MDQAAIDRAAAALVEARRSGTLLDRLPEGSAPARPQDAMAIQDAVLRQLGEAVAAWKVSTIEGVVVRGAILASRIFKSPASVPVRVAPMRAVEVEIAFLFERGLPPRDRDYTYDEVAAAAIALPAIEIVDSRFRRYKDAPLLDRAADCISNAGLVHGAPRKDWRSFDLKNIEAALTVDGKDIVRRKGGHVAGDPLLPAIDLANDLRRSQGLAPGVIVTTGTYTGMAVVEPGQRAVGSFAGFGTVELTFLT